MALLGFFWKLRQLSNEAAQISYLIQSRLARALGPPFLSEKYLFPQWKKTYNISHPFFASLVSIAKQSKARFNRFFYVNQTCELIPPPQTSTLVRSLIFFYMRFFFAFRGREKLKFHEAKSLIKFGKISKKLFSSRRE